ncbi:MAG: prepilin-type N-terminal cleavage/methylation domain-containing protein [Deltaproteobacteria bacterium]|nr:prepilin-type N-terminal cleavage/methylation domain-containing protein [Deltaproteobacteria bacterium]
MTRTLNKKLSTNGFTLLEIIVAMGLIAIALVAVIQLHTHNIDLQTESKLISMVNFLASARLAEIRSTADLQVGSSSGNFGEDHPMFQYKQEVESIVDVDNLYKVTVTIHPDDQEAGREFVFDTYVYRKKE